MPYTVRIDDAADLIRINWSGPVVDEEIQAGFSELLNDPGLRPGLNVLADHRDLISTGSRAQLEDGVLFMQKLSEKLGNYKFAVVVSKEVSFGMVRAAQGLTTEANLQVKPFYSVEEAKDWLRMNAAEN